MAQFIPFGPSVEVNGETVLSFINALPSSRARIADILANHGIVNPQPGQWYAQKSWLDAFKEIAEKIGPNTLFMIGKAIPENAQFPPHIDSLEKGLGAIDMAYHMNHRGGEIGFYKLAEFNEKGRYAIMECKNPYPCDFDRGIITTMARKFKPKKSIMVNVTLDKSKPGRLDGKETSYYKVTW